MPYEVFWHLTPTKLQPFVKAHEQKIKEQDLMNYYQGMYFVSALNSTVGNMFKKKGTKPIEYIDKSIMEKLEEKKKAENMTEEERIEGVKALFERLGNMQKNFEESKKQSGKISL